MGEERTHYEVLGVDPHAPKAQIRSAYHDALEAAQRVQDTDQIARVRRAWQVLSDPVQRQRYDDELGVGPGAAPEAPRSGVPDGEGTGAVEVVDTGEPGSLGTGAGQPVGAPAFLELPTMGRRLTASLIDVVTMVAVFLASITVTFQITGADAGVPGLATLVGWVEFWILVLFVIPTARTGQTLGKRFTYLMTVDRETGNLCSVTQVLRRYLLPMVAIPALLQLGAFLSLFYGLSYAMSRDQVSLADRLARTVVVIARYRPTRPARAA